MSFLKGQTSPSKQSFLGSSKPFPFRTNFDANPKCFAKRNGLWSSLGMVKNVMVDWWIKRLQLKIAHFVTQDVFLVVPSHPNQVVWECFFVGKKSTPSQLHGWIHPSVRHLSLRSLKRMQNMCEKLWSSLPHWAGWLSLLWRRHLVEMWMNGMAWIPDQWCGRVFGNPNDTRYLNMICTYKWNIISAIVSSRVVDSLFSFWAESFLDGKESQSSCLATVFFVRVCFSLAFYPPLRESLQQNMDFFFLSGCFQK